METSVNCVEKQQAEEIDAKSKHSCAVFVNKTQTRYQKNTFAKVRHQAVNLVVK